MTSGAPGVAVPPILVGGMADAALSRAVTHAALSRAVTHADGWFALPLPPAQIVPTVERLAELAAELGRPGPAITGSVSVAIDGDPALPDRAGLIAGSATPNGVYGLPAEAVAGFLVTGGPAAVAERISALGAIGAERVVVTLAAGDWFRQAELLAEAVTLVR